MVPNYTYHRLKILIVFIVCLTGFGILMGRLGYLMLFQSAHYTALAEELHERERSIKAARGRIYDANGTVIADNRTVCTVSVIHSQISDADEVVKVLSEQLELDEVSVRKKVEKISSREIIKSNVDKAVGDAIRVFELDGVKVDEDYKRYYPFGSLASKVLGFTGGDNQGIIGLEVKYENYLKGQNGMILTQTDARGVEIDAAAEGRIEPVDGNSLYLSLDMNIQKFVEQEARKVMEQKQAKKVSVIVMNPKNGEIYAMVNVPEFDLNDPFTLNVPIDTSSMNSEEKQELLNQMWRNPCINDTYEPGSTFKIITAAAGLEEGVVSLTDTFHCPGYRIVEDRRIHCHKVAGHGSETFVQGVMNSCNPVFIEVGLRLGVENMCRYFNQFGLLSRTGIDLPGEAGTIMHKAENMGEVELATVSFGQSFQITPIQLITTASSIINGGIRITPHFAVEVRNSEETVIEKLSWETGERIVSEETSETMRNILEQVVAEGTGHRAYLEGYRIGGKTATSEKLPRSENRYIASFIGFAPADDPEVIALITIDEPQGIYYGGTIAAPVVSNIFDNILPYLGIEKEELPEESSEN
ncbi:peptidoglycan D,D-transpeptidase FtsI family protein [Fusibacillus kribbianus]|uniref:Penicillin-binding transpeptidase domain-containing protein n=1 Tax=Fusibacillus kribbianus TaxID=3044208 RepID=A0AAP4EXZ3_9FIRM|nr:penicillin-binding transpeptidase domain-containing protein [Ruminococcus sp. YH-rum2234]MDI9241331.1 penicillin-binding transpeptidase domain-containing protein [Ruminococcus sp. YH-rum2234]